MKNKFVKDKQGHMIEILVEKPLTEKPYLCLEHPDHGIIMLEKKEALKLKAWINEAVKEMKRGEKRNGK